MYKIIRIGREKMLTAKCIQGRGFHGSCLLFVVYAVKIPSGRTKFFPCSCEVIGPHKFFSKRLIILIVLLLSQIISLTAHIVVRSLILCPFHFVRFFQTLQRQ